MVTHTACRRDVVDDAVDAGDDADAMTERHERSERASNDPSEHLTFAEMAERMGISIDAVRMRVKRGTLASVRMNERTFVVWPQPERPHDRGSNADRSSVHEEARIAHLEAEILFLRQQLDHQAHIIAGLVQRVPELPAGETAPDAAQSANTGPQTRHRGEMAAKSITPASDSLALRWRAWWRRIRSG